jgi:hypothetical protein
MTECYCLQFLDLVWTIFYTTSLVVLAVLDLDLEAVDLVVLAVDLVVPAVDGEGVLVVPAVEDGETLVGTLEALVDLIRVMVGTTVDMV